MTVQFETTTSIDAPRDAIFDLCLDIDVHRASMGPSKEQAIAGVTSGLIGLDEEVTWRATHFGVPFTMTSRVTALERPRRFVDEQVRGPFRRFRHEHVFELKGNTTVMIDRVSFDAPVGAIGRVVERIVLGRYLQTLIETRGRFVKTEAEKRAQGDRSKSSDERPME